MDESFLPLPVRLEDVDAAWLTAALRARTPEAAVQGVEVVDVLHGTCTKARLRLELNAAARDAGVAETVILKGGFEPHSRDMGFMHETEVRGYRDVLPVLGLPSPACWFAAYDADRRQGIVVMEDLVARGAVFCSALRPSTYAEAAERLTALARFHARTWGTPQQVAEAWPGLNPYMAQTRLYGDLFLDAGTWAGFARSPRGAALSVRFHDAGWMRDALDRLAAWEPGQMHAVLHGDTHPGNLYLDRDGTPGFFDPTVHRGPAISEVSYHLACALDQADRAAWERDLVAHYLAELRHHGVDPPDLETAMRGYGATLARALFIFMINDTVFQPEAVNTAYTARIGAAMLAHDTAGLLETLG